MVGVLVAMWAGFLGLYRMYLPCVGGVTVVWFIKVSWISAELSLVRWVRGMV